MTNRLSILAKRQIPDHIQESYSTFVEFVSAYYEFLGSDFNGSVGPSKTLTDFSDGLDIDTASELFLEKIQNETAKSFPKSYLARKDLVLKHLKYIYKSKGSANGVKALFQLLYGSNATVWYPSEHLLIPSDGIWVRPTFIRVTRKEGAGEPFDLSGRLIRGVITGNTAFVERVMKFYTMGQEIYELHLNAASISGTFSLDIELVDDTEQIAVIAQ